MSASPPPTRAEWALTAAIVLGSLLAAWSMGAPAGEGAPPWTFTGGGPR